MSRPPLHALTLWRPWPWAILHGGKHVENRPWPPPSPFIGQWIALHAGKAWDSDGAVMIDRLVSGRPIGWEHPSGVIVGVARIRDCTMDPHVLPEDQRRWFMGPYGWLLGPIVALPDPVACRGFQKLWRVREPMLSQVRHGFGMAMEAQGLVPSAVAGAIT